jgi:hypothetical protein
MRVRWNNFVCEQAGAETGSGAGGSSVLTSSSGGGAGAAPKGDTHSANSAGANQEATGNNAAGDTSGGKQNNDWKSTLPKELQDEPSLKLFHDVAALAKSYVNAQKLVGADKVPVPSKHATDDDWKNVFTKLGLPQDLKEYEVKFQEGVTLDKQFSEEFKETAHKAGILPRQAQALADWFSQANAQAEQKLQAEFKSSQEKQINALKEEWGQAFDLKIEKARQVLREASNPELVEYLETSGLGNDAKLIKLLANVADKFLGEGKEIGGRGANEPTLTPKEARTEYNKILSDMTHPYWNKSHPGHKAAVDEVAHLMKMTHPGQKTIDSRA